MTITRRSFLKGSAAAAVTLASGTVVKAVNKANETELQPGAGNKWPGRVAINYNAGAVILNEDENPEVVPSVVMEMVDDSIKLLTDQTTVGAAWKAVFPDTVKVTSTIAIKVPVSFASKRMAPHWSVIKGIVDGLTQMDFDGTLFPAGNITVYEMEGSNTFSSFGYTETNLPGVNIVFHSDSRVSGSADGAVTPDGGTKYDYAKSMQKDFLINVFRAGGHGGFAGGFSLGFKNHYGTYQPRFHTNNDTPGYLRDINCTGVVYNKNVLSVCAGLFGAKEASGSPGSGDISYTEYVTSIDSNDTSRDPKTIIMSTDPVSAEMQAIKMMRINNGKGYEYTDMPSYLKASAGIPDALSDKVYNIGILKEDDMDIRRMVNGEKIGTEVSKRQLATRSVSNGLLVKTLKNSGSTFIEFTVPHSRIGSNATVEIFDMKGVCIYSLNHPLSGIRNNLSWNGKTRSGHCVSSGTYVVSVTAGTKKLSKQIIISR